MPSLSREALKRRLHLSWHMPLCHKMRMGSYAVVPYTTAGDEPVLVC